MTRETISPQDKTTQQADNSSHTGAAKVLDNSHDQQYIGPRGHDKLVRDVTRNSKARRPKRAPKKMLITYS